MQTTTQLLLTLTLLLCGAYAGMVLMCQIGVLPAMRRLQPKAYADAWRAMDFYLARSMPPYKLSLLLLNAATIVCLYLQHRSSLAMAAVGSFLFSVAGLVATVRGQLPLNAKLQSLPADAADHLLIDIREKTVKGFSVRFFLAATAFVVLAIGVVYSPL